MDAVTLALMQYSASSGGGTTRETVTGNAPITLSDASAKPIVSLTQTGLCAQASTPTPSAPVDIKCNNGALKMVDDELPSGYKRVLGFSLNDNCYWKFTDFKLNGSDTIRFSFLCTASCNVIGAYSGSATGNNYSLYVAIGGGNYLRYKGGAYNSGIDANTRYDVAITPTGSSGMKTDSTWTELEFTTTTDFCVGTTSTSTGSAKMKGSFFGDVIVDGRMHLIPCERVSDNVLGYYDLEGEAFYAPTSGTPTSLGYDGSHYSLQTVGTAEVLTVSASGETDQTASLVDLLSVGDYADTQEIISGAVNRKVGIKVFDGTEDWTYSSSRFRLSVPDRVISKTGLWCTHFAYSVETSNNMPNNSVAMANSSDMIFFRRDNITSLEGWESYLAAQYAAGTPVIVLYPLAEPTTESVAGQHLSTAEGTNVVSVTAEVSPVALEAVYKSGSGSGSSGIWLLQCLLRTSQRKIRP